MIQSMTAFARVQAQGDWGSATWELRSVNHRYLDLNLYLPEEMRALEMPLRELSKTSLSRGKVDGKLQFTPGPKVDVNVKVNHSLVNALIKAAGEINLKEASPLRPLELMRWPGVVSIQETGLVESQEAVKALYLKGIEALTEARQREGAALSDCILQRCTTIDSQLEIIRAAQPAIVQRQREKLQNRVRDLMLEVDPTRIEQEIAILAQKMDIAEECDRLDTHVKEIMRTLKQGDAVGRRLDFLIQECHREVNTISSKSMDVGVTKAAVELKVLVEQMREQVQNIE
jgi:uncharacterized protein (TIGR00255 family)